MTTSPTQTFWNVPYQRNPFFTGREDILSRLKQALHAEKSVALSQPQGITGLGGIGKTQAVIEYAYRHREEYDAVLWVRADSVTSLVSSMAEMAQILELPERGDQDQELIVQAVLRWLRFHSGWLLIYDNIDDLSLAERFLPRAASGHLLFTTRAHALGGLAQRLDVQQMEPEIGALLLLRRASLLALQATLNMANPADRRIAQAISEELNGLPLALDQAGAYIKETPCPLPDYLMLYQTCRSDLLRKRGSFDQDYPAPVATTWSLSFEKISQTHPAAPELLYFCSFLSPDAIPEEILTADSDHLGEILAPVVTDPLQFDQVCKEILRFSLLQRGVDEQILTIHRLVQAVLQDVLDEEELRVWRERAMLAVNAAFPHAEHETWPQCERMLSQALFVTQSIKQDQLRGEEAERLLYETASYLQDRARYAESELLFRQAIHILEKHFGSNKLEIAPSLNALALLYFQQSKYVEAEPLFLQAASIWEKYLGSNHPKVAFPLNNLANLYVNRGKHGEAEALFLRALHIFEQQLSPEHPDVTSPLNGLAILYRQEGRYAEAEPLFLRALRIREQQLGAEHPDVAYPLTNLANLYVNQGRYAEAEPLFLRALHIREQQLGAEHPQVAYPLHNLADLYSEQGRYVEAEPLFLRAVQIWEQQSGGPDQLLVAYPLAGLAELYNEQEKYTKAEPFFLRALHIFEQQLSPDHFVIAYPLSGLALIYTYQGKYVEAERLYQRVLHIREQQLGEAHPDTAQTIHDLARFWEAQGSIEEARTWYVKALAVREQTLGRHHPKTTETRTRFIALLRTRGQHEVAAQWEADQLEVAQSEQMTNEEARKEHTEN